jgi:hypothetical protein
MMARRFWMDVRYKIEWCKIMGIGISEEYFIPFIFFSQQQLMWISYDLQAMFPG